MATKYFAEVGLDRTINNPYCVWREVHKPHWDTQRWDPKTHQWVSDPSLIGFIMNGEIGSEPITEKKAMELIREERGES